MELDQLELEHIEFEQKIEIAIVFNFVMFFGNLFFQTTQSRRESKDRHTGLVIFVSLRSYVLHIKKNEVLLT